jgi:hypothetical protein
MRYLKILFLSLAIIGLMSGSAFAAASLNAGNTTIASELVPAGGLAVAAVNNAYQPNGAVAPTTQIRLSLANGTFSAVAITLCDTAGTSYSAATIPTLGATGVTIVSTVFMASGTVYNFQPSPCIAGPSPLTQIRIGAGALGGSVVTMTVDNALVPGDTNLYATAPIITLVDQLSVQLITPAVDIIDFGAIPVMSKFRAGGSGGPTTSVARLVVLSNETIAQKIATGHAGVNTTCGAWLATTEALSFTATPGSGTAMGTGFHATTAFQATGTLAVTLKAAIASTDASATGNAALQPAAGNLAANSCGTGATAATIALVPANTSNATLTVNGTTVLTPRSYRLAVGTTTSGAIVAAARTILAATTAWTWNMDASQYYIPLVASDAGTFRETYIKLQSKNLTAGSNGVSVAILANDGTTTATWTGAISAGTPLTITGAQLVAAATTALKVVNALAGFAVIVTVNAPEADVFVYANMIDGVGGAKRIPVKTVLGVISE